MSAETPENDGTKMPFLKAWYITVWSFLIPVTLAILILASFGLVLFLVSFVEFINIGILLGGVVWGLLFGFIFSFLFRWHQAIDAKRPRADTPITKEMALAAGKETYSRLRETLSARYNRAKNGEY